MKIGKAGWFLVGYIPVYIIVVFLAEQFFLIMGECPGGGCADEIPLGNLILFGIIVAIFLIIGIIVFLYLKKKK